MSVLVDCPKGCGARIAPAACPGGVCRSCFRSLDPEAQHRARQAFRRQSNPEKRSRPERHKP